MRVSIVGVLLLVSIGAFALSFDDVAARVDLVDSVRLAELQVRIAEHDADAARYPGDLSLGFTPSGSLAADEGGVQSAAVSVGATLSIPTGLSEDGLARAVRADEAIASAERALIAAREQALVKLYGLYQAAWLAQEQLTILDMELRAADVRYAIAQTRFAEGALTIPQLSAVYESYQRSQTARDQGALTHRVSWLELAFAVGLDPSEQLALDAYLEFTVEPPKPPELSQWAASRDRAIVEQLATIDSIRRELSESASAFTVGSARLQFSLWDHAVSASYGFTNPSLTLGYSPPSLVIVESGPSRDVTPLTIAVSASLGWGGGERDDLERVALELELERELSRLESIRAAVDFAIRVAYQQIHRAEDSVGQAERAVEAALSNERVIAARLEAGQAGEADLNEAVIAVSRVEHNLTAARIARERALMAAVLASSYLNVHYPHLAGTEEING